MRIVPRASVSHATRLGRMVVYGWLVALGGLAVSPVALAAEADTPPAVGEAAPDFQLTSLGGDAVRLSELTAEGPVVLVVLRGYPGYQCPLCSIQVGELLKNAAEFAKHEARLLLVYPGPAAGLADKAREFFGKREIPQGFTILTDPDYTFTEAYHLRWNAPRETAYPSTFVIDKSGTVRFVSVSKTHGGRAKTSDLLAALKSLAP